MHAATLLASLLALILAAGCTTEDPLPAHPLRPTMPLPPLPPVETLRIELVSGNHQEAKVGELLPEPFVVRATDEEERIAHGRFVGFEMLSGEGFFDEHCNYPALLVYAPVEPDGTARMAFQPARLGEHLVVARVSGGDSVTFSVTATAVAVRFVRDYWLTGFALPCGMWDSELKVKVGTAVEWYASFSEIETTYTITSTSVPPGGSAFDSGVLTPEDRFRFVPDVPGTWEYRDEVSGATGRLTAR